MNPIIRLVILIITVSGLLLLSGGLTRALSQPDRSPASVEAGATYRLEWTAVGASSGGTSASAGYRLNSTSGQPGAGTRSSSANYALCAGFQCATTNLQVYLPLILK